MMPGNISFPLRSASHEQRTKTVFDIYKKNKSLSLLIELLSLFRQRKSVKYSCCFYFCLIIEIEILTLLNLHSIDYYYYYFILSILVVVLIFFFIDIYCTFSYSISAIVQFYILLYLQFIFYFPAKQITNLFVFLKKRFFFLE